MEEKLLTPLEVSKILGVSWITVYRYINQCRKCHNYRGVCKCEEPEFTMKANNISLGLQSRWRISTDELKDYLERRKDGRNVTSGHKHKAD